MPHFSPVALCVDIVYVLIVQGRKKNPPFLLKKCILIHLHKQNKYLPNEHRAITKLAKMKMGVLIFHENSSRTLAPRYKR